MRSSSAASALAKKSKKGMRYVRNVGLGFKTPKLALEGSYVDKKCPFTGNVSIRGRILKGMVISTKMKRTLVIRRDYLNWCGKYRRFEKRHKNMSVHCSPCFENVKEGDIVTVGQCRPLTKTVRFNVLTHEPAVNQSSTSRRSSASSRRGETPRAAGGAARAGHLARRSP
ncbi:rRNA binding protein [Aureococcus anophagefferens]|nr:rRNA binding protein [Aureococcus anophagefferens]